MRRRRELASREEVYQLAAEEAERVHATLMRCAVDGRRKPALDKNLSGTDAWTVLNGTYLVEEGMVELFRETIAALDRTAARITLEITGPWPPYSFAGDLEAS
jgi:N-formylglutamate amidohydrolase